MGFTLICIGFLFLFNPNFNVIDIVPDFLGLFLVCLGSIRISRLSEDVKAGSKLYFILAFVELFKSLSLGLFSNNDPTWPLLLSFSFGVVECILFVYAASSFFTGIERLGVRYDSKFVLSTYSVLTLRYADDDGKKKFRLCREKRDAITRVRSTAIAFFFARTAFAVIPELTELFTDNLYVDYRMFKPILNIFGAFVVLIWSVFFIVRIVSFFCGIIKDSDFNDKLKSAHKAFENDNVHYKTSIRMRISILAYFAAVLSSVNVNEDGLALIPLAVPAGFLIIGTVLLSFENKKALPALIPSVATVALSVYNTMLKSGYYTRTAAFKDIFHYEASLEKFTPVSNTMLLGYLVFAVSFVYFGYLLYRCMMGHVKDRLADESGMSENRISEIRAENEETLRIFGRTQAILMAAVLSINIINVKLSWVFGEISAYVRVGDADYAGAIYSLIITVCVILNVVWLFNVRKLSRFMKEAVYSEKFNI